MFTLFVRKTKFVQEKTQWVFFILQFTTKYDLSVQCFWFVGG